MKSYDFAKTAIAGLPLLREAVDRGWFFALFDRMDISWIYSLDGFSHRYRSESAVYLSYFVEID